MDNFQNRLAQQYEKIKEPGLDNLFIHPDEIYPLIDQLISDKNNRYLQIAQLGSSFLKKPIYKITVGLGPVHILVWSQMHGNEPTATASLFDLLNYTVSADNIEWFNSWRDKLTLHIVPMLNPDGAELEQRVNAQGIDINRDAKALQTPEGRLLLSLAEEIKPQFGFNLHNQSRFYSVGQSSNTAVISLLAPAYNVTKDTDEARKRAMQLVSLIRHSIQKQYPGRVGRYDDAYSYRSFGDLFSAKGISTILIESGYHNDDEHKQIPRWLNFLSLVVSIDAICDQRYDNISPNEYFEIPLNAEDGLVDVLLKNVLIEENYQVDISINFNEYFSKGRVEALGDLSTVAGFKTHDMQGYKIAAVKGFLLMEVFTLSPETYFDLLRKGYGYFLGDKSLLKVATDMPFLINPEYINNCTELGHPANFFFSKEGKLSLALIEGLLIELDT